jgi:hypothetical protein
VASSIEMPPLNKAVAELLGLTGSGLKVESTKKGEMRITLDGDIQKELQKKEKPEKETLAKAIARTLNQGGEVERLAFESDPTAANKYHSVYKPKQRLIPNKLLNRIAIQDDLVAAIVQARQNQMSAFGRPRPDRFSTGFVIEARQETNERIEKLTDPEQKKVQKDELQRRIARVTKLLMTCGSDNLDLGGNQDDLTFPQYISMSVRNAVVLGRIATEVLWKRTSNGRVFNGFRVIDAGTIYRPSRRRKRVGVGAPPGQDPARPAQERAPRPRALRARRVQVGPGHRRPPLQAFTDDECLVHNFYPVADVELDGYPVTPLDTVMSAVTTHINITTHNKLYFQSGRAARGMLVIKSDDVDETVVAASAAVQRPDQLVNNAWRMPVFGVGPRTRSRGSPSTAVGATWSSSTSPT